MESRFAVASFGVLGYELNLNDAKSEDVASVKAQIELYKQYRKTLQFGDFFRLKTGNICEWSIVSRDKSQAVTMVMQREVQPNNPYLRIEQAGLDENAKYHFYGRKLEYNLKGFGDFSDNLFFGTKDAQIGSTVVKDAPWVSQVSTENNEII